VLRDDGDAPAASPSSSPSRCELVVQVFLDSEIDGATRDGVEVVIRHLPQVASYVYQDQEGTLAEAERVFAEDPEALEWVRRKPDTLPTSFRVVPTTAEIEELMALTAALEGQSGVAYVSWEMAGVDWPGYTSGPDQPEIVVYLEQDIGEEERSAVEQAIRADPGVARSRYMDQAETLAEFERLFARNQEMLDRAHENPERLPTSYRITPTTPDHVEIEATTARLAEIPDVRRATSTVRSIVTTQQQLDELGCS
jgi:cell division protein FtsX